MEHFEPQAPERCRHTAHRAQNQHAGRVDSRRIAHKTSMQDEWISCPDGGFVRRSAKKASTEGAERRTPGREVVIFVCTVIAVCTALLVYIELYTHEVTIHVVASSSKAQEAVTPDVLFVARCLMIVINM
jgi:hypothetical protein